MQIPLRSRSVKMVDEASSRKPTQKFDCPSCQQRLWRLGSKAYYLSDRNSWLEAFFCEEHGEMWMRLSKNLEEAINATAATSDDWHRIRDPRGR